MRIDPDHQFVFLPPMTEFTPPHSTSNDKLWNVLCHLSPFIGVGLILPLIVYLVTKDDHASVPDHARESLNFHISMFLYAVIGCITIVLAIGFLILFAVGIGTVILAIVGAVKASNEELYRYPLTIRLVK